MLKYSHKTPDWNLVDSVGFDLDGTLYDEFEFISQVYHPISLILSEALNKDPFSIYDTLIKRWEKMGSSYNRIFEEVLLDTPISDSQRLFIIQQCLGEFRHFQPNLSLTCRVENCLEWYSKRFPLFLVTDGSQSLQQAKIKSLGLLRWIMPDNIVITGSLSPCTAKPDPHIISQLALFKDLEPSQRRHVYFGDRTVDRDFANNCGFDFIGVKVMIPYDQFLV